MCSAHEDQLIMWTDLICRSRRPATIRKQLNALTKARSRAQNQWLHQKCHHRPFSLNLVRSTCQQWAGLAMLRSSENLCSPSEHCIYPETMKLPEDNAADVCRVISCSAQASFVLQAVHPMPPEVMPTGQRKLLEIQFDPGMKTDTVSYPGIEMSVGSGWWSSGPCVKQPSSWAPRGNLRWVATPSSTGAGAVATGPVMKLSNILSVANVASSQLVQEA